MNIVFIKINDTPDRPHNQQQQIVDGYDSLCSHLSHFGKILFVDERNHHGCFLVSTPNLLSALANSSKLNPVILIQVFSLSSPEAQLIGTVNEGNFDDPLSYTVKLTNQEK